MEKLFKSFGIFSFKLLLNGIVLIFLAGCGATIPTKNTAFEKNIVGTWLRPAGNHHEVNLILNSDGSAVLWPIVGCTDKNIAEYGTYKLETKNVSLDDGSKIEMTFLHHNLKNLAGGIWPNYFRVNFVSENKLELIRVDSLIMDFERASIIPVLPPKNEKKLALCSKE